MSRSYRKSQIIGIAATSDKKDKRIVNRKFRRISKRDVENAPIDLNEISDIWDFAKDGKIYIRNIDKKYMRK